MRREEQIVKAQDFSDHEHRRKSIFSKANIPVSSKANIPVSSKANIRQSLLKKAFVRDLSITQGYLHAAAAWPIYSTHKMAGNHAIPHHDRTGHTVLPLATMVFWHSYHIILDIARRMIRKLPQWSQLRRGTRLARNTS